MTTGEHLIRDDFETIRKVFRFEADPLIVGNEALERIERAYAELMDDRDGKGFLRDAAETKWMRYERALMEITKERFGAMPDGRTPGEFACAALSLASISQEGR